MKVNMKVDKVVTEDDGDREYIKTILSGEDEEHQYKITVKGNETTSPWASPRQEFIVQFNPANKPLTEFEKPKRKRGGKGKS